MLSPVGARVRVRVGVRVRVRARVRVRVRVGVRGPGLTRVVVSPLGGGLRGRVFVSPLDHLSENAQCLYMAQG